MTDKHILSEQIKRKARALGFHLVGIAPAVPLPQAPYLKEWLAEGRHGRMHWMENHPDKRLDVRKLVPGAKSVIAVAQNYYTPLPHSNEKNKAKISRYAWGKDYHKIIKKKLKRLLAAIRERDEAVEGRFFVDTAPIQDKLWAQQTGLGWQGKNTNIINRRYGSWLFLGELVVNIELEYDDPALDYCGHCTACIEACPTGALQPYRIDARRCISYLTIETRDEPIPRELSDKLEGWVFGCDICQDVCPWNRFAKETDEAAYFPNEKNIAPAFDELQSMTEEEYKQRFQGTPVLRARYKDFIRNVTAAGKENI
ncbi:MAG TPA: tRNA epoxyqueuosine(34) reductase QueG [Caldithrix abyssi]|uniref:Epoxyqueuosine reductase n=1 Tax=Caldithrix abyssi TaxID=187145 RepID=A0A7V4TZ19_CALAY|nr:tRNA epoxyqueuosine(34) reductase QueG [Caldithrix abyssi]